jgi:hypothetical protein
VQSTATHKALIIFDDGSRPTHPVHPDISLGSNEKMGCVGESRGLSEQGELIEVAVDEDML